MRRHECVLVGVLLYGREAVVTKKANDILRAKYLP